MKNTKGSKLANKSNLFATIACIALLVILGGVTVFAVVSPTFIIHNKIHFEADGAFYKVSANVYRMNDETFNTLGTDKLLDLALPDTVEATATKITDTFSKDLSNRTSTDHQVSDTTADSRYAWKISDDLMFTTTERYIVFAFYIENWTPKYSIKVSLTETPDKEKVEYNVLSTSNIDNILQYNETTSVATSAKIALVCHCTNISENFTFENDFTLQIETIIEAE